MDIDHFHGMLLVSRVIMAKTFGPQATAELRQLIAQTKLPLIIKGVLSIDDAEGSKGVELLFNLITKELKRTMAAAGCPNLSSVTKSIIRQVPVTGLIYPAIPSLS